MGPELGILLADPALLGRALGLAEAAPERTQLFLMHDGVRAATDPRLGALVEAGAEVALCAMDAEARGLSPSARGPRFGSQHDHARMVRDCDRIVALTGAEVADCRPGPARPRRVEVRVGCLPTDPRTGQALRSAVAYAACGLAVTVVLEGPAAALTAPTGREPAGALRALATLRALDAVVVEAAGGRAHCVEVPW